MKKDNQVSRKDIRNLTKISISIFFLFSILIIQFYRLQIIQGDYWNSLAIRQHEFHLSEPFQRGNFISNTSIKKGHPYIEQSFTIDVAKFHLHLDCLSIPEQYKETLVDVLSVYLNLSEDTEKEELRKEIYRKSRNRRIKMWLDRETKEALQAWWRKFYPKKKIPSNALFFVHDYQRSYPFNKLLGQVLHTIRDAKDEETKQGIPTGGLELVFNDYLKGREGKRRLLRSPRHPLETGDIIELPQNGANVYLTINHYLQTIAEEEIEKSVKQSNAKGGWAIMMDPYNGDILVLAQYPFFDPSVMGFERVYSARFLSLK